MTKINVLGASMKIKELTLKNVGNITDISLHFNENMNVICGTNGIGKTTILKSILSSFKSTDEDLKKKYGSHEGSVLCETFDGKTRIIKITSSNPQDRNTNYATASGLEIFQKSVRKVYYVPDNRELEYKSLSALKKYPNRELNGINSNDFLGNEVSNTLKNWLINRLVAESMDKTGNGTELNEVELYNILQMKRAFSVVDEKISLNHVDMKDFEILLKDHDSDVFLEFESTGFKNILFIVAGIISEIEARFKGTVKTIDFDGMILIDEIDAHLHPSWQSKIIDVLKEMFPKAQFIITTHSPAVLQSLNREEIIPLCLEDKEVTIKTLNLSKYGLKGWTLEEILSDVMGVGELKNKILRESLDLFSSALDQKNIEQAKLEYEKLNQMLHPQSTLRQILDIQKAGLF